MSTYRHARSLGAAAAAALLAGCLQSNDAPEFSDTPQAEFEHVPEGLQLESLAAGTVADLLYGKRGSGPILVHGTNPSLATHNTAVVFDTASPTGGDFDLGSPNETCGGPGVGVGGELGTDYENCEALGHVLIVAADLDDADGNDLVDDPDDVNAALEGVSLAFDFAALGSVTVHSVTLLDVHENGDAARVEMHDPDGTLLRVVKIPRDLEDNGVVVLNLGDVLGVAEVVVHLDGPGAVEDVRFSAAKDDGEREGCGPGYWKQSHHFCHWPEPYAPGTSFEEVFGREVPGVDTLIDGLQSPGNYRNLVFHAVAALLNAASDDVNYEHSVDDVVQIFQDGWDDGELEHAKYILEGANERDCPLGNCRD